MSVGWGKFIACVAGLALAATVRAEQSASLPGRFESDPVRTARAPLSPTTAPAVLEPYSLNWTRVALSLGGVLALIALLRWAARNWVAGSATGTGRGVRMLGRTLIAPRQQIVMLQVGRRIIVAADCAGHLTALASITDADEVASLLGQLDSQRMESSANGFSRWFTTARQKFEQGDDELESPVLAGGPGPASPAPPADPALEQARGELAGLAERIRGLARQFKRVPLPPRAE